MKLLQTVIHHPLTDVLLTARQRETSLTVADVKVGSSAKHISVTGDDSENLTKIAAMIRRYLDGIAVDFANVPLDFSGYTPFQTSVLKTARSISYGTCLSYSELARQAGFPQGVRAVASVMRRNRFPVIIPCHRVIRKDGTAGAYCGDTTGEDARLKQLLLQLERVKKNTP